MLTVSVRCHGDRLSLMDLSLTCFGWTIEGMFHSLKTGQADKWRSSFRGKKRLNGECYRLTHNKLAHLLSEELVWRTINSCLLVEWLRIENLLMGIYKDGSKLGIPRLKWIKTQYYYSELQCTFLVRMIFPSSARAPKGGSLFLDGRFWTAWLAHTRDKS